jgi:hypothetical protein
MADEVAWTLIEPGWDVVSSDGSDVGHVDEVTGDENIDIFNGLAISSGLGKPRYVPAEQVARITEGRVELALSKEEVERLGRFDEPPVSAEVLPDAASRTQRAEEALVGSDLHAHRMPLLRRLWFWLRAR